MRTRSLKITGIVISIMSAFLILALLAELYYLLWWKKRRTNYQAQEEEGKYYLNGDELGSLCGPPRFLFTIKEETKEDLDQLSRSTSTSTPYMTPLTSPPFFTPPVTPMRGGFNPLFESYKNDHAEMSSRARSSPPPAFKFMRDAEDKLYRKILTEEAKRVHSCASSPVKSSLENEDGSFISIVIAKKDKSQVNPLPSPP